MHHSEKRTYAFCGKGLKTKGFYLGAVFCGTHFRNPVSLAKEIMDKSPHCVLSGDGALDFAQAQGFETCAPEDLISDEAKKRLKVSYEEYEEWIGYNYGGESVQDHDTVSAVAMDKKGNLACATSTGTRKHCIFLTISFSLINMNYYELTKLAQSERKKRLNFLVGIT
jgi:hypothetical protein